MVLGLASLYPAIQAAAGEVYYGDLRGQVVEGASGMAVSGAQVRVDDLGLAGVTDAEGRFSWDDIPMNEEILPVTVRVTAEGFGEWAIVNVRLVRNDTLILSVELGDEPVNTVLPEGLPDRSDLPDLDEWIEDQGPLPGDNLNDPLPETIKVRVTKGLVGSTWPHCSHPTDYVVVEVNFKYYVKHVLPNEWLYYWVGESLRAGGMAVKTYAWHWIARGGKWSDADVYDSTCDQVYDPSLSYASTNAAVDWIWNWRMTLDGLIPHTSYRTYHDIENDNNYSCEALKIDFCMGQYESNDMAAAGESWADILFYFYEGILLTPVIQPPVAGFNLRYNGSYSNEVTGDTENRLLIPVDGSPGPPVDVGAGDFTIELWLKAAAEENVAPAIACGDNDDWKLGNIILNRAAQNGTPEYGLSLAGGKVVFGVTVPGTGSLTLCSPASVTDGEWRHILVQRHSSDGHLWLFVDGVLAAEGFGPVGDISYPDDAVAVDEYDPYLVVGAWKGILGHDVHPSFYGWLEELRFSTILRQTPGTTNFTVPEAPYLTDGDTVALYHFDTGYGNPIYDTSGAAGGPSDGVRVYGGSINGPAWGFSSLFQGDDTIGTYTPAEGRFQLRNTNEAGAPDLDFIFAADITDGIPLSGDWDGDGADSIGVFDPVNGEFRLRNSNDAGLADITLTHLKLIGAQPIVGDWDGDGVDTIGIYRDGEVLLRNSNSIGRPDGRFTFGEAGLTPLAGDWDGDGMDTIGTFDPVNGKFKLRNANSNGPADIVLSNKHLKNAAPLVGDWDSDGVDTVGIYKEGLIYLRNTNSIGPPDETFIYGGAGLVPLSGDWDGK